MKNSPINIRQAGRALEIGSVVSAGVQPAFDPAAGIINDVLGPDQAGPGQAGLQGFLFQSQAARKGL